MATDRFGIAFCTTHIPAEQLRIAKITAVRYKPSPGFAELALERDQAIEWQSPGLDWTQDEDGTLQFGPREPVQAIIEVDGELR
jgi:hypothetical protein